MPDVTVTPSTVSVTVSGSQPIGTAEGDLRGTYPSPLVDAEAYNRRGYVLWSDFSNNATPWSIVTAGSGSTSYTHTYDGSTINYIRMATSNTVTASRAWISDRHSVGSSTNILAGNAEMIISARVRFNRNADAETTARFGFFQGHREPIDNPIGDGCSNGIYFYAFQSDTWKSCCVLDYDPGTPTGDGEEQSTTGASTDWRVLRITVNAAGTECKFYVDGTLSHTVTDAAHIPKVGNVTSLQSDWMHAGALIRASSSGSTLSPTLDVDWMHFEYRMAR